MSSKKLVSDKMPDKQEGVSRREFARRAAMATAAVAALPGVLLGEAAESPATHLEQTTQATTLSPAGQAEAKNKVQAILNKYGSRLNDEQKNDIRRLVAETQKQIGKLRAYALDNSDQPATVLKPLMERAARPAGPPSAAPVQKPKM